MIYILNNAIKTINSIAIETLPKYSVPLFFFQEFAITIPAMVLYNKKGIFQNDPNTRKKSQFHIATGIKADVTLIEELIIRTLRSQSG